MSATLDWTPEPQLLRQLNDLAEKKGQSLNALLTEAVIVYLQTQIQSSEPTPLESDPLIGLFAGSPNLSAESKTILQQEISSSGWTWK